MSSYKKRQKTLKRTHRERGQLQSRQHLGLLEKHKDYVLRAKDYQEKKAQLKLMHEKARNRNPDEFYYKMIKTKLKDGRHVIPQEPDKYTPEELQLMKTQDCKYIQMKLSSETKKVERLQSCLHHIKLFEKNPPNTHTIFVDSAEEVAKQASELRNQRDTVKRWEGDCSDEDRQNKTSSPYRELKQRIQRCKELTCVATKMKTRKDLMGKGKCVKIKGDGTCPAIYKWKKERQK